MLTDHFEDDKAFVNCNTTDFKTTFTRMSTICYTNPLILLYHNFMIVSNNDLI